MKWDNIGWCWVLSDEPVMTSVTCDTCGLHRYTASTPQHSTAQWLCTFRGWCHQIRRCRWGNSWRASWLLSKIFGLSQEGFWKNGNPFQPGPKNCSYWRSLKPAYCWIVKLNHGTSAVSGWTWSAVLEEGTWSASSKPWLRHPLIHSIPHSPYCWRKVHIIKLCSWETWVILTFIFGFPSFFTLIINSLLFRHLRGTIQT